MKFQESERIHYELNPLLNVIFQTRFPRKMSITLQEPAEFQDIIMAKFPLFTTEDSRSQSFQVDVNNADSLVSNLLPVEKTITYKFENPDNNITINLSQSAIAVYSVAALPPAHWAIRNITNSAGFTGAMPITQINLPLSISSCVMVVLSHFTKNASSGFVPIRAPSFQTVVRNWVIVALTLAQSLSLFGSKTTH